MKAAGSVQYRTESEEYDTCADRCKTEFAACKHAGSPGCGGRKLEKNTEYLAGGLKDPENIDQIKI